MLEDDQNITTHTTADDLPRPPAGRRSARRPAGPPASRPPATVPEVAVPEVAVPEAAGPEVAVPEATVLGAAGPQAVLEPSLEAPAIGAAEPAADASVEAAAPARRTRKRTAKATVADVDVPIDAAPAAELTAQPVPADPSDEDAAEAAPTKPARAPRKRAASSRKRAVAEPTLLEAAEPIAAPEDDEAHSAQAHFAEAQEPQLALPPLPEAVSAAVTDITVDTAAVLADLTRAIAGGETSEVEEPALGEVPELGTDADVEPAVVQAPPTDEDEDEHADDESDEDEDEDDSDDDPSDDAGESPRRRRRRRGGRRRRRERDDDDDRGADASAGEAPGDGDAEAGDPSEQIEDRETADDADPADNEDAESGTRRRRRRRRRRGEGTDGDDDPDTEVVVRVREPRKARSAADEVTGIEGSTRLEAKRQRRRDGRSAGRRRTPILSEAEFLARRESVERVMILRQQAEYTQIGVLEDGVLSEHYVDRASSTSMIGNIYLGRVQNVLPSMEAAFIDIGRGRNAVLYAGEVDWNQYASEGQARKMENVFKSGQSVLVQVTKDPVGQKGARLTSHLSLPGRYIVFSPGGELSGISRKLADTERARLKEILGHLIDDDASVIVRTAAEGVSEEELVRDVNRLTAQWEDIQKRAKTASAPAMLYSEPDATVRIVRDLFTEDFSRLIIDGNGSTEDAYDVIQAYVTHVAPHLGDRIEKWDRAERGDLFAKYRIDEQIAKALERKVFLPSGGSLVIDRTEAMTVIDVNTGKFTGTGGNLEATVTSNNLEAAEEIVRQLRLRDIGGIIVIDFIDMVLPSNRELLLRRLVECLGRDRTRHQVAEVTSLGLVQMTRKKIGTGLAEAFTVECEVCHGRGYHRHEEPVETQAPADGGDRTERRASTKRERSGRKASRSADSD